MTDLLGSSVTYPTCSNNSSTCQFMVTHKWHFLFVIHMLLKNWQLIEDLLFLYYYRHVFHKNSHRTHQCWTSINNQHQLLVPTNLNPWVPKLYRLSNTDIRWTSQGVKILIYRVIIRINPILNHIDTTTISPSYEDSYMVYKTQTASKTKEKTSSTHRVLVSKRSNLKMKSSS
jgi:hypothetical protein